MFDNYKCKKCNKPIGWDYNIWNSGLCDSCKYKRNSNITLIAIICGVLGIIIGGLLGMVEYNYSLNKCQNLDSSESNYDFDLTIEKDAQYNSGCYYLTNHPLAVLTYVIGGVVAGIFIAEMVGVMILMIATVVFDR